MSILKIGDIIQLTNKHDIFEWEYSCEHMCSFANTYAQIKEISNLDIILTYNFPESDILNQLVNYDFSDERQREREHRYTLEHYFWCPDLMKKVFDKNEITLDNIENYLMQNKLNN